MSSTPSPPKRAKSCRNSTSKKSSDINDIPDSFTVFKKNLMAQRKHIGRPYEAQHAGEEPAILQPRKKQKNSKSCTDNADNESPPNKHRKFDFITQLLDHVVKLMKRDMMSEDLMSEQKKRMEVYTCSIKGRGVWALTEIQPGQYVCPYKGVWLDDEGEVNRRRQLYSTSVTTGSYIFESMYRGKTHET